MEPFGSEERPFTLSEKEKIKNFLKFDSHVPAKFVEMVVSAERQLNLQSEAEYFERLGFFTGSLASSAFFFFPIIRQQPIYRRLFFSMIPFYLINRWGKITKEDLEWGKGKIFNKFIMLFKDFKFIMVRILK